MTAEKIWNTVTFLIYIIKTLKGNSHNISFQITVSNFSSNLNWRILIPLWFSGHWHKFPRKFVTLKCSGLAVKNMLVFFLLCRQTPWRNIPSLSGLPAWNHWLQLWSTKFSLIGKIGAAAGALKRLREDCPDPSANTMRDKVTGNDFVVNILRKTHVCSLKKSCFCK